MKNDGWLKKLGLNPVTEPKPVVLIEKEVADKIDQHFKKDIRHECGDILIGNIAMDGVTGRPMAYISDVYSEEDRIGKMNTFEFAPDYLLNAKAYVNKKYRSGDKHIIGNVHSHGLYPSFWSDPDYEMMAQARSFSVYMVVSPSQGTCKVAVKDRDCNLYEDCEVKVIEGGAMEEVFTPEKGEMDAPFPPDTIISNGMVGEISPEKVEVDEGNGRIRDIVYHVHPVYTDTQHREFAKRFLYGVDQLKDKKLLIVGAGTIGNLLAQYAVCNGISDITVVDMDQYHYWNLPRSSMIQASAMKKGKAVELAKAMAASACFDLKVEGICKDICDLGWGFLKEFDLVLSPVDSLAVRMYVDRGCKLCHIPHITCGTGVVQDDFTGNVLYFPKNSSCDLEYFWGTGYREKLMERMGCSDLPEDTQSQVMGFSAQVAGLTMDLVMKELLGQLQDDCTAYKYTLNAVGHGYQTDKNAYRVTKVSRRREEHPGELYEVFDPDAEIPSLTYSRTMPKSDLYAMLKECLQDSSDQFFLDLRWSLNLPVAYHTSSPLSEITVSEDGGKDPSWYRLPDSHVYCVVNNDGRERLVEIRLTD